MRLLSFVCLGVLTSMSAYSAPPTIAAGADGNSIAFKNGASEAVVVNTDGTVEAATPTANNHLATKEYVDTQIASASGGGAGSFMMIATSANPSCPSGWTKAYSGMVAVPRSPSNGSVPGGDTICSPASGNSSTSSSSTSVVYYQRMDQDDPLYCSMCVK